MIVSSGGIELEVEASPPEKANAPLIVLSHPHPRMGGDMDNKVVDQLFRRSAERGWGVVRFNFRGVGKSTGQFDAGHGETDDLLGVLAWASKEFGREAREFTLVGYSFGSWITAKAASMVPGLARAILIAPPIQTMDFSVLEGVTLPKHVFAAGRDEFAPRDLLDRWFSQLTPPKTIRLFDDADHFFVAHTTELIRAVLRAIEPP